MAIIIAAALTKLGQHCFLGQAKAYFSGGKGEETAIMEMENALPSTYHIFPSVRTQENMEADMVIVGPAGVFDIEVKNYNGQLEINPDNDAVWILHKRGRKGGEYHKTVKSPIRQMKRNVYLLAKYLREHDAHIWVDGAVLFVNEHTSFVSQSMIPSECFFGGMAIGRQIIKKEETKSISQEQISRVCAVLEACNATKKRD